MRKFPRWLKISLFIIGAIVALLLFIGWLIHEPLPQGKSGPAADALARKIQSSVRTDAWDSLGAVSWHFAGVHEHLWDKKRHFARVRWQDGQEVLVDINRRKGIAFKAGQRVDEATTERMVQEAWAKWVNDSYWLNPIAKFFDPGTERALVHLPNGEEALLLTHTQGGATPGDSYLWKVDEKGRPTEWKMWVGMIPIGGLGFTWENWQTLPKGAQVATLHEGVITLELEHIEAASTLDELVPGADPFATLQQLL